MVKEGIAMESLCEGLPAAVLAFMKYVKSLQFVEEPNYSHMRGLLRDLGAQQTPQFVSDGIYDWTLKRAVERRDRKSSNNSVTD